MVRSKDQERDHDNQAPCQDLEACTAALQESRQHYHGIVEHIALGVLIMSARMEILALNQYMKARFPWIDERQRPICYRSLHDPPRDRACASCPTHKTLVDGGTHEGFCRVTLGGRVRRHRVLASPIMDQAGRIVQAIELVEVLADGSRTQHGGQADNSSCTPRLISARLHTDPPPGRSLAVAVALAQERERRRIAADVHDHLGQHLAFARIKLAELLGLPLTQGVNNQLVKVMELVDCSIRDVRGLILQLGSPVLKELGFVPAVQWLVRQTADRYGIRVEFRGDQAPKCLGNALEILLFQAIRELLANVAKHARARRANVCLSATENWVVVDIRDDGVGFNPTAYESPAPDGRFGLFSIYEQLELFGGTMSVNSQPGWGTRVTLAVPLEKTQDRGL
ncbi:MAG: sensor histidine kinase [Deltaproteobacteria bacterium]|nr:sensor histidine kinase [Deltaproteobacteria bacterium]